MKNNSCVKVQKLILVSVLFISSILVNPCFGQKISKYYVTHVNKNSTLYSINTKQKWVNKELKSTFEYDIKYDTSKDSIVINFFFISPKKIKILNLRIQNSIKNIENSTKNLFIDNRKRNLYHYQCTTTFLYKDFKKMFSNEKEITSFYVISNKGENIELIISRKKWQKQQSRLSRIFELISFNKSKK
ncbi:MAG: hypothetical protein IMY72_12195 [Bacteroidetes bacterium]|nr:hypothetical protein [Bacteroidota bacterium]